MFDFANQAYTLLIITVIFGDLFTRVIVGHPIDEPNNFALGNLLWSVALATSYALVVVFNPILGAIMDSSRLRKSFLWISCVVCVIATSGLYWVEPGWVILAMALIIVSNGAYAFGESFVASFLPGLGPRHDLGWISGLGWGLGYIGGLVATAFALVFLGEPSIENYSRIRWVGPFAAVFFLLAALPTFLFLKDRNRIRPQPSSASYIKQGWRRLGQTHRRVRSLVDLRRLLMSIFFMMAGLYIVISFAFIYGAQVIGWSEQARVTMFVTVQISAAFGALGFGWIHQPIGPKRTYQITLLLWIMAIAAIWQTPTITQALNRATGLALHPESVFLVAGLLSGLSLGASQSAGRALVGALAPYGKAAEFFGYWGTVSKLAALFGIFGLGILQMLFGLANAVVFCLVLLVAASVIAQSINVDRGIQAARSWQRTSS